MTSVVARHMDPVPIGDSLRDLLRRSAKLKENRVHTRLSEAWRKVAGANVAGHTSVRTFKNGMLTVAVDSPPLCHELASFHAERLLVGMNEQLPTLQIRTLRFRLGTIEASS